MFAAIALFGSILVAGLRHGATSLGSLRLPEFALAVSQAVSSASFIVALNHTTVANVLFMQAGAPLVAAVIAWAALGEPVTRLTAVAMVMAVGGVCVIAGGPGGAGGVGLGLSLLMTVGFAVSIVITRHRREVSMAPAICLSQVLVLVSVGPFSHPETVKAHSLVLLMVLGFGQIGLGLTFLTMGARLIPAVDVALISLFEVVLGPLWVWLAISERPSTAALAGGLIVLLAVLLQSASGLFPISEKTPCSRGRLVGPH